MIKKKIRAQENPKEKKKNVFTKQTSRDGLDEAVSNHLSIFFNYIHFPWLKAFSDFFFFLLFFFFGGVCLNRMMSDYKVEMINDGIQEFYVHFQGPNESKFFNTRLFIFIL